MVFHECLEHEQCEVAEGDDSLAESYHPQAFSNEAFRNFAVLFPDVSRGLKIENIRI